MPCDVIFACSAGFGEESERLRKGVEVAETEGIGGGAAKDEVVVEGAGGCVGPNRDDELASWF